MNQHISTHGLRTRRAVWELVLAGGHRNEVDVVAKGQPCYAPNQHGVQGQIIQRDGESASACYRRAQGEAGSAEYDLSVGLWPDWPNETL